MGWLLNFVYALLLVAASPLIGWRMLRHRRYRRGWRERLFGLLPPRSDFNRPLVWLHAVSVGEVLLLPTLTRRLASQQPDLQFLVTTSTDTGFDVARDKLAGCRITWMPLDFTWAVRAALRRVRPDLVLLVELELWPNLIRGVGDAGIPLTLVNARLSERSFRGYRRLRRLVAPLLNRCTRIAAQSGEYARRFVQLGADSSRVHVTGSIKFDGVQTDRRNPHTRAIRAAFGWPEGVPVFVAGSTQSPEEEAAIDAWRAARRSHPDLLLVLVPRHRERFENVATLLKVRGVPFRRRSQLGTAPASADGVPPVLLVDTIGELSAVWGLADIAYVGGSLTAGRGGQNMLEPAAFGAAVLFGPHTENFRASVQLLLSNDAAAVIRSALDLADHLGRLLDDPCERERMGKRARQLVGDQQGATARTVELLSPLLTASHSDRRAA
ncbi:MAG: 3-deoxy-D-manno-octulosonic acid transferase [Planctomycetaceae bacterium]|nr:3-deoxy-D-manno-octulosonic acid transferase [Planctomycetaceae bacterium]